MRVYITDRLKSETAHQRLDCTFLTRRPRWMAKPMEVEATKSARVTPIGTWVDVQTLLVRGQVKIRTIRLCARCGS